MDPQESRYVEKSEWERGPWDDEPDRVEWRCHGLPCLVVRSEATGALCGYVGVPPGHPWHGKSYNDVDAECHGGLTYSAPCSDGGHICHVPQPGESDVVHWLGFDCGHAFDVSPAFTKLYAALGRLRYHDDLDTYRPLPYVRAEVECLALQAAKAIK